MRFVYLIALMLVSGSTVGAQDLASRLERIEANNVAIQQTAKTKRACTCAQGDPCKCDVCECQLTYAQACAKAVREGKLLVVYVGIPAKKSDYAIVCHKDSLEGYPARCIVSAMPVDGLVRWVRTDDANGKVIESAKAVSRAAIPFGKKQLGQTDTYLGRRLGRVADGSPWLSVREQQQMKSMWPDGVPFPKNLKFYKLRPASQAVAAFNIPGAGDSHRFVLPSSGAENPNRDFPWVGSGGMDFAKKGTWRNVTGMAIPDNAKIEVWRSPMDVSGQQEWAVHWQYPAGTQMFDVLVRKNDDGSEHIFNVRRRIKKSDGWDDGASFLPDVQTTNQETYHSDGSHRSRDVLGIKSIAYRLFSVGKVSNRTVKFHEVSDPSISMNDGGHFFPPGFKGAGMSCNKCHNGAVHEAKKYGGPLLRGKDTVFSWYPVDPSLVVDGESLPSELFAAAHVPAIDFRWPLVYLK